MALVEHPTNSTSYRVIGSAIEVHRMLGPGLLESSYHSCLCRELELREVPYQCEVDLPIRYKGVHLPRGYVIDLLVEDSLIVEIKSVEKILPIHASQLLTYMRLREIPAGLLINFNVRTLFDGIRRILR